MSHFQLVHEVQIAGSRTSALELFKNLVVLEFKFLNSSRIGSQSTNDQF